MRSTFIIPSRCSNDSLFLLLQQLGSWVDSTDLIVLVAHDARSEALSQIRRLASPNCSLKILPVSGTFNFSRFINLGLSYPPPLSTDTYFLLNDDLIINDFNVLDKMKRLAMSPDSGFVGVQLRYPHGGIQHSGIRLRWWLAGTHIKDDQAELEKNESFQVSGVTFAMVSFSNQTLLEVGRLDERMPYGLQDLDMCLRAQKAGKRNQVVRSSEVFHHESLTRGNPRAIRNLPKTIRDTLVFRLKHPLLKEKHVN